MTSRLKRKLNQSAAEGSSPAGNLLESFVQYGTPLPSLDKAGKKDKNEFVPVWEQTVTDDQGRRRLHGAFTGGFSAGYYNTVGSKEGWTPSQFVSSRSAKRSNEQQQQRAEDFMDEEDLADLREADLKKAASDHASKHQQQQGPSKPSDSDEAGDRLLRTIQQSRDSTGVRLLKNMGWKEGQGTGPRLSAAARQRQARELRASGVDHEDWTALAQSSQTFAPLDRPLIRYSPKDDAHGLGWEKGMSLDQPSGSGMHHKQTREGQTDMPLGGAFGISALEDADDDDYSVYDTGNRENESSRRSKLARMVFDEDDAGPPQQKRSEPKRQPHPRAGPSKSTGKYLDGTPSLPGYTLSQNIPPPDAWFAPPDVPKDWQSDPKTVMSLRAPQTSGAPTGMPPPPLDHRGRPIMTADDRANMLSDEPPKAKSVFDFISKKNQERIANAKAAGQKVASTETTSSAPPPTTLIDLRVPELDKTIAEAALKGFMPYADNQGKQARYRLFLQAAAGEKSEEGVFAPRATADRADELQKELDDFKRSAMVFKPMSRAMASRFTSGDAKKTAQDMKMPHQAGLAFVSASTSSTTPAPELEEEKQPPEEETDPVLIAVRSGMFGALTRNTTEFYPCKLLCKRFGVRQPHPTGGGGPSAGGDEDEEGAGPSKENEKDLLNKSTMDDLRQQSGYVQSVAPASKQASEAGSALAPLQPNKSIGLGEDDAQGADILTYERPSIDIFKAIFEDLDDADEEFAEQKSSDKAPEQTETIAAIVNAAPSQAQKANLEPVSFTDFKPTFIRRAGDPSTTAEGEANNSSEPKKKKKKKKDKGAALSFAMEDGDDPEAAPALPKKEKRKKSKTGAVAVGDEDSRKKPRIEEAEVEDEWVEKPSAAPVIPTARARARAADLF